jgi:hypothetical protein
MNESAISLERLHDILLPAPVPWWPPAPGWYVLLTLSLIVAAYAVWRTWRSWRANAYRRAALRELTMLADAPAIAALLRRTSLVRAPRRIIAAKIGTDWTDWLGACSDEPMSVELRRVLIEGAYGRPTTDLEIGMLRDYAARWIARHRVDSLATPPEFESAERRSQPRSHPS